jgi:hypothetical protein
MNFIELTSYIGEPEGYADFPNFPDDIWPLLTRKSKEVESLYLFRNDDSLSLSWSGHYEVVTQRIVRIRSMAELTKDELDRIRHLSFYGGHLNVLYRVSTQGSLLSELCKLFPVVRLSSDDIDQLGLEPEALAELRTFTAASPAGFLHFSFGHDGDPLYIFGDLEPLRALLRSA